jgi:hypothetical protein
MDVKTLLIIILAIAVAVLGYLYDESLAGRGAGQSAGRENRGEVSLDSVFDAVFNASAFCGRRQRELQIDHFARAEWRNPDTCAHLSRCTRLTAAIALPFLCWALIAGTQDARRFGTK